MEVKPIDYENLPPDIKERWDNFGKILAKGIKKYLAEKENKNYVLLQLEKEGNNEFANN